MITVSSASGAILVYDEQKEDRRLRSVKAENVSPIAGSPPANEVKYGYVLYLHSARSGLCMGGMKEARLTYQVSTGLQCKLDISKIRKTYLISVRSCIKRM
jgi:hypothetical protein